MEWNAKTLLFNYLLCFRIWIWLTSEKFYWNLILLFRKVFNHFNALCRSKYIDKVSTIYALKCSLYSVFILNSGMWLISKPLVTYKTNTYFQLINYFNTYFQLINAFNEVKKNFKSDSGQQNHLWKITIFKFL